VASVLRVKAPVQLAASHLVRKVRAEATVSCRGRGGSAVAQAPNLNLLKFGISGAASYLYQSKSSSVICPRGYAVA
jgi:hypothetical protein